MTTAFYDTSLYRGIEAHVLDADLGTCEALCVLLRFEGLIARFSASPAAWEKYLLNRKPSIYIVNADFDGKAGRTIYSRIRRSGGKFFTLLDTENVDKAVAATKAGARDVFTKPIDTHALLVGIADAIRELRKEPDIPIKVFEQLTPREREILQRVVNGRTSKEVAQELGISPRTVDCHRASLMAKLGVRNVADLIRRALE